MPERDGPILILSSIPIFTRNLVWAAGEAGRACWVMDVEATADWRYASNVLGFEPFDRAELAEGGPAAQKQLLDFLDRDEISAVAASDTRCSRLLLQATPALPAGVRCFPMADPECFEELYDKARFAELLGRHSLPHPETRVIRGVEELLDLDIPLPAIVKPTQGEGGVGITTVATREALRADLEARSDLARRPVVVQAFVPGRDIDLSLLAGEGRVLAWTIQRRREDGTMEFVDRPDILELCRELVARTHYHGVVHIDLRIDERDDSVVLIEANPRFWGSLCYSTWAGVDFLDLGLRLAWGEDVSSRFEPVTGESPYLGVTRGALPRLLLGGRPTPRGLDAEKLGRWRFHHGIGSRGLRTWLAKWGPGRTT